MNILQQQDALKGMPDQALQKELLQPTGSMPGFLVLTELNRRKQMRDSYSAMQRGAGPNTSMAEEFARGVGGADVGKYAPAVRQAVPEQAPMEQPQPQASAPQGGEPQAFASGGEVGQTDDWARFLRLNQYLPGSQSMGGNFMSSAGMGGDFSGDAGFNPEAARGPRRYLGPGTPSPLGFEQTYFGYAPVAPAATGAEGIAGAAPIAAVIQALADGSANGATGAAGAGSSQGGEAGTVGASVGGDSDAGGAASGVGGDDGGTYAGGGGVIPFMDEENALVNVPDVPETFVRDTRTMQEKFRDAMRRRSTDMGSAAIEGLKQLPWRDWYDKNRAMVDKENQMEKDFWTPRPGMSIGQSISDKINGRIPDTNVGEATSPFDVPVEAPRGLPSAVTAVYPEPNEASGVPNNVGPDQEVPSVSSVPDATVPGRPGVVAPNMAPPGGGSGGVRGGLNIGGEGLDSYVAQVKGLQQGDGFGDIEKRILADRAELEKGRESDKGLALLTAGLGIMGGASPFAAVNIGQGAMAGVKQYNEATKEQRAALRDLRNAENQITIARANRDERQLEKGISLYARAQENLQRSLDRQSRESVSSADRQANRALKEKELEAVTADRRERAEQARVADFGTRANQYGREADAIDMKIATLQANPLATSGEAAGEIARLKAQSDALRQQSHQYGQMYNRAIIEREVKSGRLVEADTTKPGYAANGKKLKKGEKFVDPNYNIRIWQGE